MWQNSLTSWLTFSDYLYFVFVTDYKCIRHFEKCSDGSQCIPKFAMCRDLSGHAYCKDGSDTDPAFCRGETISITNKKHLCIIYLKPNHRI